MDAQCPDCGATIPLDNDIANGDVVSCPCCSGEFVVKIEIDGCSLSELIIEGEDWGE